MLKTAELHNSLFMTKAQCIWGNKKMTTVARSNQLRRWVMMESVSLGVILSDVAVQVSIVLRFFFLIPQLFIIVVVHMYNL